MINSRKVSVSFVSEALQSNSNEGNAQPIYRDPNRKILQQKLLRLQVAQVVLSLTLMVLSAIAIIEERVILSLGFGAISAAVCILTNIGIQQSNPKVLFLVHGIAICGLVPALYFTINSLWFNIKLRLGSTVIMDEHFLMATTEMYPENISASSGEVNSVSTTTWILGWLELLHLIPLTFCLIYSLFILKYLDEYYYTV